MTAGGRLPGQTSAGGAFAPGGLMNNLIRRLPMALLSYWLYFLIAGGIAGAIAFIAATKGEQQSWTIQGTLLYNRIPIPAQASGLYEPPDLKTMCGLAKSPAVLEQLCDEFELDVPIRLLDRFITVHDPKTRQSVLISMTWDPPPQGIDMVNRFMELFPAQIAELRRKKVEGYLDDLQTELASNRQRLEEAETLLTQYHAKVNALDADSEETRVVEAIASLQEMVATRQRERDSLLATMSSLEERLAEEREKARVAYEQENSEDQQANLAEDRRRQNRLNELIEEEKARLSNEAEYEAMKLEVERARKLYQQNFISRAKLESLEAKLKGLESRVLENPAIKAWRAEMQKLDARVVPDRKNKTISSPAIEKVQSLIMETDLNAVAAANDIQQLQESVKKERGRLETLRGMREKFALLQKNINSLETERETINSQMSDLRKLASYGPREFSVVAPATSVMHPPTSTKKKTFVFLFAGMVFLLCAPPVALEVIRCLKPTAFDKLINAGLLDLWPLRPKRTSHLKRSVGSFTTAAERWAQLIALRIQQLAGGPGSVVLFSPVRNDTRDVTLVSRVAQYLALRDERVVILSTTNDDELRREFEDAIGRMGTQRPTGEPVVDPDSPASLPVTGLAEYLMHECEGLLSIVGHTPTPGVDCIPAGSRHVPIDRLTTARMAELMAQLKEAYTVVLIHAPQLSDTLGLEVHARYADGMIFAVNDDELISGEMRYTLQSLRELHAPLWGVSKRPPLITDQENEAASGTSRAVRILIALACGICRSTEKLGGNVLRLGRRNLSTDRDSPQETGSSPQSEDEAGDLVRAETEPAAANPSDPV